MKQERGKNTNELIQLSKSIQISRSYVYKGIESKPNEMTAVKVNALPQEQEVKIQIQKEGRKMKGLHYRPGVVNLSQDGMLSLIKQIKKNKQYMSPESVILEKKVMKFFVRIRAKNKKMSSGEMTSKLLISLLGQIKFVAYFDRFLDIIILHFET